ncbi:cytochrome c oxidase subunit II [Natronorubrum sp. JWXQ-INN-674]|uniref:cytochrome-c oxidase n=1 Tax=Natronorubrum halalkaliphilum TaxID=2691917 RepID=A0A6B0VQ19_9EURY|nr:cytochrome c oxidase subunit II [Natronorubrum halalkaliphilum]MXV63116.1 cytochrome c oxidase subunit II [Natronorubrum halalkaliphilum]
MGSRRRYRRHALTAVAGLVTLSSSVAAQSENRDLIDGLEYQLLYVALPLTLFVLMILVYAAVKFYDNDDPKPTAEDPALEITWTAATAIILLFVGIAGYSVLVSPYISPSQPADLTGDGDITDEELDSLEDLPETDDEEVVVRGYQWGWEVTYPDANVTTRDEIVIPADEDVTMWLTADDVIHALFVQELGIKQDAFPGEFTRVRTVAYETGQYNAVCTEFCGAGHSRMDATVHVVDPDTYEEWLEEHEDEQATPPDLS